MPLPKNIKKIKGLNNEALVQGLTRENIESIQWLIIGSPPRDKDDGLTDEEYKEYLAMKYGADDNPRVIRQREIIFERMIYGKDTPFENF